ncbi:unnamed protein product [Trifolium pratense]|uniref:Uncharacterized protein n=1 Tax=Trifolium pratense TaxID=57577 RepID=A0ACB0LX88_TRIPR|nr:unnamed protein product [Trifolium pratense]
MLDNEKMKKKRMTKRKDFDMVEEMGREVMDKQSGISVYNDEVDHSDYGSYTNSTTFEKKSSFDPINGCSSSN